MKNRSITPIAIFASILITVALLAPFASANGARDLVTIGATHSIDTRPFRNHFDDRYTRSTLICGLCLNRPR